jgi:hypothetical protein
MTPHPLRAGLAGLVDYAGLFPPASEDLPTALTRFERYAEGDEAWMLGRLIVPLPQLGALSSFVESLAGPLRPAWTVSVLVPAESRLDSVADLARQFNEACEARGVAVVSVEFAAAKSGDVERFAAAVAPWLERYVELPPGDGLETLLDAGARNGLYAKVRTGGVTADRFPTPGALASFIRATVGRDVPFKATAGLHHPLRNKYRLTYEPDSPLGRMHGFINLLVATTAARRDPAIPIDTLCAMLDESSPAAFTIDGETITWKDVRLSRDDLVTARAQALRSVGSCSFEEPVADLRALGWWPEDDRIPRG